MKRIVSVLLICVLSFLFSACNLNEDVNKSKVARDKVAIAEIRQAIIVSMETAEGAKPCSNAAKVNNGKINIKDLIDTSNEAGMSMVESVESILGQNTVILSSSMTKDCTVQIVLLDYENDKVVIQVKSEAANMEYYIDETGEHEGTY